MSQSQLLKPLQIGSVTTRNNLILSPMSGVTDSAFRRTVLRASGRSVGLLVSEFIAAEGLSRDNPKTKAMLRYLECERPISIQIFGADVDRMVRAAVMVEEAGADILDINCGCPAPKVVRRGGGAQLMRTPEQLRDIIRAIRRAISIPVTVKIRSGWDDANRNALDIARIVEDEGAAMLAVHPRTRLQLYSGTPDWDLIGEIHRRLKIPVAGSGDIVDPQRALDRIAGGYCDAVMIGRGAIDEPWIFAQIDALDRGAPVPEATADDRAALLSYFRRALEETREERSYLGRLRGLAYRMAKGVPGGSAARRALSDARTASDIEGVFRDFILDGRRFEDRLAHVA
ncbi:MAG TPA: tRNA dihydrouridine synthase DusB [Candidatus Limnocylindrales bacterium]|nr:tRNA dihydrouridine synthase DusB [Candidatus Limnocylindrales bacterium]